MDIERSSLIIFFPLLRLDTFRVAASDIGLITKVFVEMYNTGQLKKWYLEKVGGELYGFMLSLKCTHLKEIYAS